MELITLNNLKYPASRHDVRDKGYDYMGLDAVLNIVKYKKLTAEKIPPFFV